MVPTAVEENALYLQALSGEISQTLTAVSGVVNARVHLVTSPAGPHSALRPPVKARASVLLKARHGEGKALEQSREGLQALVAGSVDGLDAANVSILISEIAPSTAPTTESPRRSTTRTVLVGGAALIALLSICLALSAVYARRLRMKLASRPPHLAAEDANPPADDDAQSNLAEAA
jgi:type III secretion protein J